MEKQIIEITDFDPISYEGPPGEGVPGVEHAALIDPYHGCQLNCPYCMLKGDDDWNKKILVKMNFDNILETRLKSWNKSDVVFLGAKCDPYMSIEEKYCLTRKCLFLLNELQINTMIMTKSDNNLIFRDIDIISNFKAEMTVLLGISNINQVKNGILNENIKTANKLCEMGIRIWLHITPILPYIMDVEKIISVLNPSIPLIFLDKLWISRDTIQAKHFMEYIESEYPEYCEKYLNIINENNMDYFNEVKQKYSENKKMKILY